MDGWWDGRAGAGLRQSCQKHHAWRDKTPKPSIFLAGSYARSRLKSIGDGNAQTIDPITEKSLSSDFGSEPLRGGLSCPGALVLTRRSSFWGGGSEWFSAEAFGYLRLDTDWGLEQKQNIPLAKMSHVFRRGAIASVATLGTRRLTGNGDRKTPGPWQGWQGVL